MVTVEEIQEAIKNRKPIFYPNNRISYDAYKFLRKVTKADRDILLSEFPPFDPQKRYSLFIVFTCPLCGKEFEISFSKAKFISFIRTDFNYQDLCETKYPQHTAGCAEFENYIKMYKPKGISFSKFYMCQECCDSLQDEEEQVFEEFYNDPLFWVNTHSPEQCSWQWDKIVNLYAYPEDFSNRPEGWKYCGVKYKERYSNFKVATMYESNYQNWKNVQDRTIIHKKDSTAQEIIQQIIENKSFEKKRTQGFSRTLELAKKLLDGIINDVELKSLLDYVAIESAYILKISRKQLFPTKVFNFGKYKGYNIHEVIDADRDYITWALTNLDNFMLDEEAMKHYRGEAWEMSSEKSDSHEALETVDTQKHNSKVEEVDDCPF